MLAGIVEWSDVEVPVECEEIVPEIENAGGG